MLIYEEIQNEKKLWEANINYLTTFDISFHLINISIYQMF